MQRWIMFVALLINASDARYFYPYSNNYYHRQGLTTSPPRIQEKNNDMTTVDPRTGIRFNPYSKHHPGRHVCTHYRNVSYPVKARQVYCKPIYKKYMVRCGDQWCSGVRLVYEKYHKDFVTDRNRTHVDYVCCPGWTQVNYKSHGCNKPVCQTPCLNGGTCVQPNCCACPPEYTGNYCEHRTTIFGAPECSPPCLNGGTCSSSGICLCPSGYDGIQCQTDIDECKINKPCDQICYNTPGSYKCECKENFVLQEDGQSCRTEFDEEGTTLEAKDLEFQRLDKRLKKLEKIILAKFGNDVTKKDLNEVHSNIDKLSQDLISISDKIGKLSSYQGDVISLKSKVSELEQKSLCEDENYKKQGNYETSNIPKKKKKRFCC